MICYFTGSYFIFGVKCSGVIVKQKRHRELHVICGKNSECAIDLDRPITQHDTTESCALVNLFNYQLWL